MANENHLIIQKYGHIVHFLAVVVGQGSRHLTVKGIHIACKSLLLSVFRAALHHKELGVERAHIVGPEPHRNVWL